MGVKSSLSPPVKIKNEVRRVQYLVDFSEKIEIEYKVNDDGEIVKTPAKLSNEINFSVLDEKDSIISDISVDEIFIAILSEDMA